MIETEIPFFVADGRAGNGMPFDVFLKRAEDRAAASTEADPYHEYRRLNIQRMHRVIKTYTPGDSVRQAVQAIPAQQTWMVVTEDWCGDSSQTLPVIAALAMQSDNVTLSIVDRDDNLDVMDAFLTNGSRGIPKVVALSESGRVLWTWGPRPTEAQQIVTDHLASGADKTEMYAQVHAWYARNRGQATEQELASLIRAEGQNL